MRDLEVLQSKLSIMVRKLNDAKKDVENCTKKYQQAKVHYEEETEDIEEAGEKSFAYFIRTVIGSQERKIEKEKQEQIEARYQLDKVSEQLEEAKANYEQLAFNVTKTRAELEDLKKIIAVSDPSYKEKVDEESKKRMGWRQELVEVDEAFNAGKSILNRIDEALKHLGSANSWSTMDMLGGGFFTDMMKYDKIDEAENLMSKVESELRRYELELKDVEYEWNSSYEFISGGHRAMDIFFDNIFTDISNNKKINNNINSLETLKNQIITVQNRLKGMKREIKEKIVLSEQIYESFDS
ncbi:hypothetical protein [Marinilactibacillus psychrotolerans]|uniref:DUF5082 domain-containing protein n=1 Tax=Marinilactibacillus psychrotolerans TaxID=191770 RepID=A0AAV3WRK1_9LACT|nr:hypothetical protein [Marinilactibacillus psychrotolerans]GEL66701.1 hypothetical protein MPS01_08560 [Marinilactibacillus psychrotolerans]GEQ35223.1 hypothetical protein M132T_07310 [Marinilactibacillus psychrotolerans]SDD23715.1 hypothetical protein SAMN04488013_12218 [Marinilactibacillus psychrotolerans]